MFVSPEFDIFARKPVHESILETLDVVYKPIASVDQNDLEFLIPADNETYIDPDINLYVRGKLTKFDGTILDEKDFTSVTNNFLHSLFSQCTVSLNGTTITRSTELYNYRSLLETLLTYCNDAATIHLRNAMWIMDAGNMVACDPTSDDASNNKGFVTRWSLTKKSQEIALYRRVHTDFCNVPVYLLPGVRVHIKFTKARTGFYLMNTDAESKTIFQFLDAQLWVKRVRPNPTIPLAHKAVLDKGGVARYNMTSVELKSFTFSSGSQSLSIDNALLGPVPKPILFTMIKNKDILGSIDTNPYFFRHYDLSSFALYVNGRFPAEVSLWTRVTRRKQLWRTEHFLRDRAFITRTRYFR